MYDTPPDIERQATKLMSKKTPEQRLKMVSSMFATSKKLIKAGLEKEKGRSLSPSELKSGIFLRMYSDCFTQSEIEKIIKSINSKSII